MSIDLRSDTVTKPSPAMREAMAAAEVGDDVYGEDPSVIELERRVADLLGQEAALFTPTGSMANQLGLRLLVQPGQELICDAEAHVVRAELGAAAALSGITTRTYPATAGRIDVDRIADLMRPQAGPYFVSTAAVVVENTHNFGGGSVQPLDDIRALRKVTQDKGVLMHLDGARIWNAHVASGVEIAEYADSFDTVSVCFSKGLGAAVGSALASTAERIATARIWRKRLGGGMRQAGILAAGATYALDHNVERMAEDHARARRIADRLAEAVPGSVDPDSVETNIVVLEAGDAASFITRCRDTDVLIGGLDATHVRVVTHLDVDDAGVDRAIEVFSEELARS
jgi:threonine aldolase